MRPLSAPLTAGVGPAADRRRPRRRVAGGGRRECRGHRRLAGRAGPARGDGRDRAVGPTTGRSAVRRGRPARRGARPRSRTWSARPCPTPTGGPSAGSATGPGVCKIDWALSGPVPWTARGVPVGGHRPPRGDGGRGGGVRGGRLGRPPSGPAVLHRGPARGGRPDPGPAAERDPVGLLPRALGVGPGHDGVGRGPDRAVRPRIRRPRPGPFHGDRRRDGRTTTPTTSVATSAGAPPPCSRPCPAPCCGGTRTGCPSTGSTCARPRRRPGPACTGCAGSHAARTVLHDRFGGPPPFAR